MALEAYFSITSSGGVQAERIKLLSCEFGFQQQLDETGRPATKPRGGLIHLTIESTDKEMIAEWMLNRMSRKNGRIEFPLRNNRKKVVTFEDGICVSYNESYNSTDNVPMVLDFTISANKITLGSATFNNDWKLNT